MDTAKESETVEAGGAAELWNLKTASYCRLRALPHPGELEDKAREAVERRIADHLNGFVMQQAHIAGDIWTNTT